jgi:hypothetical protein
VLAVVIAFAAPAAARADDTTPPVPDLVGHPMGSPVSDTTASYLVSTNTVRDGRAPRGGSLR